MYTRYPKPKALYQLSDHTWGGVLLKLEALAELEHQFHNQDTLN